MRLDLAGQACLQRHAEGIGRTESGWERWCDAAKCSCAFGCPSKCYPEGATGSSGSHPVIDKGFPGIAFGFGDYKFHVRRVDVFLQEGIG